MNEQGNRMSAAPDPATEAVPALLAEAAALR
jgi:hypothetical protein